MDAKQAAQEERKNMEALGDPVFLTFTGFEAKVVDNKLVELAERDEKGKLILNKETKQPIGTRTAPGRILKLSHLGKSYLFRAEDLVPDPKKPNAPFYPARQMVPRHAAQHWIQDSLYNWENKVFFKVEEAGELVPASEKGLAPEEVQALIDQALANAKSANELALAELQAKHDREKEELLSKNSGAAGAAAGAEGDGGGSQDEKKGYTANALMKMNKEGLAEILTGLGVAPEEDATKAKLVDAILTAQEAQK